MVTAEAKNALPQASLDPTLLTLSPTDVLEDLRNGWLATSATAPKRKKVAPAEWTPDSSEHPPSPAVNPTAPSQTSLAESLRMYLQRLKVSLVFHSHSMMGDRGRAAGKLAVSLIAVFTVVVALGAFFYSASVSYILDPTKPSGLVQPDPPPTSAAASPAVQVTPDRASSVTPETPPTKPYWDIATAALGGSNSGTEKAASALRKIDPGSASHLDGVDLANPTPANAGPSYTNPVTPRTLMPLVNGLTAGPDRQTQRGQPRSASPVPAIQPASTAPAPSAPALSLNTNPDQPRNQVQNDHAAVPAKILNSPGLPAEPLLQAVLAKGGNPRAAEAATVQAISEGGQAVFELQHLHASPSDSHPARIVITAKTLQFVPEGPCPNGPLTVPLALITSVQVDPNTSLLNISFNGDGLTFGNPSFRPTQPSSAQSRHALAQQTALFTAIRNLILSVKSASLHTP